MQFDTYSFSFKPLCFSRLFTSPILCILLSWQLSFCLSVNLYAQDKVIDNQSSKQSPNQQKHSSTHGPIINQSQSSRLLKRNLVATQLQAHEHIKIDGKIQEQAWQKSKLSKGFTERQPQPGRPSPAWAGVRAMYNQEALYIAVVMKRLPNETPSAFEMRRDQGKIWSDDTITLKIDAGLDQRTTLGFVVNSAGAHLDFISLDNGQVMRLEYDAIWEAKSHIAKEYWSVEYRIPFTALAMSPNALKRGEIGFNVTRDHNLRQATDDWQHLPPEFGPFSALHYGRLSGLKQVRGGHPLIFMPYGLMGSHRQNDRRLNISSRVGGELRYGITSSEWLELSILTDFAQVDLDDPLINLDRFSLFLPERRPFFTYGLDVFSFGSSGVSQIFFSRRIGLNQQGQEVPIYAGAKAYGKRGSLRYGILSVMTGDSIDQSAKDSDQDHQKKIWNVGRLRYDWGKGSYVGMIVVNRQNLDLFTDESSSEILDTKDTSNVRESSDLSHLAMGVDTRMRLLQSKLELGAFYSMTINQEEVIRSSTESVNHSNTMNTSNTSSNNTMSNSPADVAMQGHHVLESIYAGSAAVDVIWRGHNWRPRLQYLWVDQDFDPQVGFVSRQGYHQSSARLDYLLFRPKPWLRSLKTYSDARKLWSDDTHQNLGYQAFVGIEGCQRSNWCYALEVKQQEDVVENEFSLAQIKIQPDVYDSQHYKLMMRSPRGKRLELKLNYTRQQGYFGGSLNQFTWDSSVAFHPTLRWFVLINAAQFEIDGVKDSDVLSDEVTMANIMDTSPIQKHSATSLGFSTQILFTPTPKLSLDTVSQINSDRSTLIWQARMRWRYLSGSDLFVVLRRKQRFDIGEQDLLTDVAEEWRFTLKLNFRYDLLF
jgi:hypothetical protein